jgi:hypothetical protein
MSLRNALKAAALSEAECIVFAPEGLLLAHDFPFNCGIRFQDVLNVLNRARSFKPSTDELVNKIAGDC